ncbi:choice-of-anchor M domain-containing protein [Actinoplanes sp. RD1]|uniref:choice-of-anchor M domain-containing protein n=1 Tax=Actinoplanes sp. RD1 TaxID=3064538 RepID=UPI0027410002|nr:choice-of-anchor M domain-containing protein [Actinoplanes sp. RD1]
MKAPRIAAALAALAIVGLTPAAAHAAPVTLSAGHVDILDVDYAAGALSLDVLDGTGATEVERAPADVVFQVPAAAKVTVPSGSAWSFLGTPGSTAWVLPQAQQANLLFAGWNTLGVPAGALQPNSVTVRLNSVTGPGRFSVYTTGSFGTPTKLFDSGDGLPDNLSVSRNVHAHANWAFSAAGTYTVTFEVTVQLASTGAVVSTGAKAYTFSVLN